MDWRDTPTYNAGLEDFTRVAWTSSEALTTWGPRIGAVVRMFSEIERQTVVAGLRPCALLSVDPLELVDLSGWAAARGLVVLILSRQAVSRHTYSAVGRPAEATGPFNYRAVLGVVSDTNCFRTAWTVQDNSMMGELLGYPRCCREFFNSVWVRAGWVDSTWPMASETHDVVRIDNSTLEVSGPAMSNILMRWQGVRGVPHLPCSFSCTETASMGESWLSLADEHGYFDEVADLREMLDWPMEWSALHGIAEVKTPVNKVSTRTVATPSKLVIRRAGAQSPGVGAFGLRFPFHVRSRARLSAPSGILPDGPTLLGERYHLDNGFNSLTAMREAHRPIVAISRKALVGQSNPKVLDLGCGNGALLAAIQRAVPASTPMGIDVDINRVHHARALLPRFHQRFLHGNLMSEETVWQEGKFDLALLMPARLCECEEESADRLRERLRRHVQVLIVYVYADVAAKWGDLETICQRTGLKLISRTADDTVGLASAA
jgi:hypothetical protein